MGKIFLAGIAGILISGIFATLLMVANASPLSGPDNACTFSSGYGVGATACDDISEVKASPPAAIQSDVADLAATDTAGRD